MPLLCPRLCRLCRSWLYHASQGTGALDPLESEGASMDIDDATPPEGL